MKDENDPRSPGSEHQQSQGPGTGNESVGETVADIAEDLQNVVRNEVRLAKTELKDDARRMGMAGGMVAGGGVLSLTGFVFLMLGVTYLINRKLPMWLSAGIVGMALMAMAAVFGMIGKNQLQESNLKPEQTLESIEEDKAWARREMNSVTDQVRSTMT